MEKTIGSGGQYGQEFSLAHVRHVPVLGEEVSGFTDGTHNIRCDAGSGGVFSDRDNFMIALVEGGRDEVVHPCIHNLKVWLPVFFIQATRDECSRISYDKTARFHNDV